MGSNGSAILGVSVIFFSLVAGIYRTGRHFKEAIMHFRVMSFYSEFSPRLIWGFKKKRKQVGLLDKVRKNLSLKLLKQVFDGNGFAVTHEGHNVKAEALFLARSALRGALQSALPFVGRSVALRAAAAARCLRSPGQVKCSFRPQIIS